MKRIKKLTILLLILGLMSILTPAGQPLSTTSYSWSEKINQGEVYKWIINEITTAVSGNISGIQESFTNGTIISIEPKVNLADTKVDFISIDADQWSNYFKFSINNIELTDPEDFLFYNFLIIPVVKTVNGSNVNVFEEEIANQTAFPGNSTIEEGKFIYQSIFQYTSSVVNVTETGSMQWDVSSGILQDLAATSHQVSLDAEISATLKLRLLGIPNDSLTDSLPIHSSVFYGLFTLVAFFIIKRRMK